MEGTKEEKQSCKAHEELVEGIKFVILKREGFDITKKKLLSYEVESFMIGLDTITDYSLTIKYIYLVASSSSRMEGF